MLRLRCRLFLRTKLHRPPKSSSMRSRPEALSCHWKGGLHQGGFHESRFARVPHARRATGGRGRQAAASLRTTANGSMIVPCWSVRSTPVRYDGSTVPVYEKTSNLSL